MSQKEMVRAESVDEHSVPTNTHNQPSSIPSVRNPKSAQSYEHLAHTPSTRTYQPLTHGSAPSTARYEELH